MSTSALGLGRVGYRRRVGVVGEPVCLGPSVIRCLVPEGKRRRGVISLRIRRKARKPLTAPATSATTSPGAVCWGCFLLPVYSCIRPGFAGAIVVANDLAPCSWIRVQTPTSPIPASPPFVPSREAVPREASVAANMEAEGRIASSQGITDAGALQIGERFLDVPSTHGGGVFGWSIPDLRR